VGQERGLDCQEGRQRDHLGSIAPVEHGQRMEEHRGAQGRRGKGVEVCDPKARARSLYEWSLAIDDSKWRQR
jgi:hypothetical protein